jgi:hypothetical protein
LKKHVSILCIAYCFLLHFRCNTTILNCRYATVVIMYYAWLLLTICYLHQSHSCYSTIHSLVSMIWNFISHSGSSLTLFISHIYYWNFISHSGSSLTLFISHIYYWNFISHSGSSLTLFISHIYYWNFISHSGSALTLFISHIYYWNFISHSGSALTLFISHIYYWNFISHSGSALTLFISHIYYWNFWIILYNIFRVINSDGCMLRLDNLI